MLKTKKRKPLKQIERGILVAIEGIDGAGKTTQAKILLETLTKKGYSVIGLHEPTEGKWGAKIRELAKNGRHKTRPKTEFDFFYLDREEDVRQNIEPSLEKKKIVVMDRYYFSSVAYQGERGLDLEEIEKMNELIAPEPDVTIILDMDPEVSLERIMQKRNATPNHFERKKYLARVRRIFLDQFKDRPNIKIIEGDDSRSVQEIASDIWKIVQPIVKDAEDSKD